MAQTAAPADRKTTMASGTTKRGRRRPRRAGGRRDEVARAEPLRPSACAAGKAVPLVGWGSGCSEVVTVGEWEDIDQTPSVGAWSGRKSSGHAALYMNMVKVRSPDNLT